MFRIWYECSVSLNEEFLWLKKLDLLNSIEEVKYQLENF